MPDREENPRTPLAHRKRSAPTVQWLQTKTPPLTRGRRVRILPAAPHKRNTPAYAGKTASTSAVPAAPMETPPLTRGRRSIFVEMQGEAGNTPAYAGKTSPRTSGKRRTRKHPRLRGEDISIRRLAFRALETPPLTRGRHKHSRRLGFRLRNTPAYAGKTGGSGGGSGGGGKHPRLRGEDPLRRCSDERKVETPPLTRGRRPKAFAV